MTEEEIKGLLRENIVEQTYDLNIVDMGMVYNVDAEEENIRVDFSPPSKEDPKSGAMAGKIEQVLRENYGKDVEVNLVTNPQWNPEMMSETARENLQNEM